MKIVKVGADTLYVNYKEPAAFKQGKGMESIISFLLLILGFVFFQFLIFIAGILGASVFEAHENYFFKRGKSNQVEFGIETLSALSGDNSPRKTLLGNVQSASLRCETLENPNFLESIFCSTATSVFLEVQSNQGSNEYTVLKYGSLSDGDIEDYNSQIRSFISNNRSLN